MSAALPLNVVGGQARRARVALRERAVINVEGGVVTDSFVAMHCCICCVHVPLWGEALAPVRRSQSGPKYVSASSIVMTVTT